MIKICQICNRRFRTNNFNIVLCRLCTRLHNKSRSQSLTPPINNVSDLTRHPNNPFLDLTLTKSIGGKTNGRTND